MSSYLTRRIKLRIGELDFSLDALQDLQQFDDTDGAAERAGISSALWPLFGQAWPSGSVLANYMVDFEIDGMRILEIGCGLALSSLVLQQRGADITASDHHPLAEAFLQRNARLNHLALVPYQDLPWETANHTLGRFDLIIGSDVLYERGHAAGIAALVQQHSQPTMQIVISDPGRGNGNHLSRALVLQGFRVDEQRLRFSAADTEPFKGRLLHYRRDAAV